MLIINFWVYVQICPEKFLFNTTFAPKDFLGFKIAPKVSKGNNFSHFIVPIFYCARIESEELDREEEKKKSLRVPRSKIKGKSL